MRRSGFTMIELVFVIVVLGILAAIAIPKFAATRDDAHIAKGRSDVAAIRAAIVNERQSRLLRGMSSYAEKLDSATDGSENQTLFDKNPSGGTLLQYGIVSKNANGHWMRVNDSKYTFKANNMTANFDYNSTTGTFNCKDDNDLCKRLTQ